VLNINIASLGKKYRVAILSIGTRLVAAMKAAREVEVPCSWSIIIIIIITDIIIIITKKNIFRNYMVIFQ